MNLLLDAMRELRAWQFVVLGAVLLAAGGAAYGAYVLVAGPDDAGLAEGQQLIPVQRGDLVNGISINGSLVYANREELRFASQGTIDEILVEEGQQVGAGQVMATLDVETIANLERAVAQSRIDLRNAEEALEGARDPHSAQAIAKTQADVASARLSLRNAEDALDQLVSPTDLAVARAEADVAGAEASLGNAEDALARLLKPTVLDIAKSENAVTSARLAVEAAQAALDDAKSAPTATDVAIAQAAVGVNGATLSVQIAQEAQDAVNDAPSDGDVADAQALVDSAATTLANAQGDLRLTDRDWGQSIQDAGDALASTRDRYLGTFAKWLGVEPDRDDVAPEDVLAGWGVDLESLFDRAAHSEQIQAFGREPIGDDPETPWSEITLYTWLAFFPGEVVGTCDNVTLSTETVCVMQEMDGSWQSYEAAEDALETAQTQSAKRIAADESAVASAEKTLASREEALADLMAGPDDLEVDSRKSDLGLAEARLQGAEDELAELRNGADALDVESKRQQLAVAKANLSEAEEDLAALANGGDPIAVEVQRRQVALAGANLDQAREDLAALANGADALDLRVKETQVALARAGLDESLEALAELRNVDELEIDLRAAAVSSAQTTLAAAVESLEGAALRAPFSGIVSAVAVEPGQQVNRSTLIIEVVDPSVVEVDGIVDEIDVLFIREGAGATVTMDALPGQELEGTVSALASGAITQQGVVSYPLRVRVRVPDGLQLPEGLSALASVVVREDLDVLLVPFQALYGTFEQPIVRVNTDGRIEDRDVVLGNSDDFWVVVVEGVAEAELVVMESEQATTGGFGFGGGFGQFRGGQFRGGQFGGGGAGIPGGFGGGGRR